MPHIRIVEAHEADAPLRAVYEAMMSRPIPAAYRTPHGGPAGIIRAHSLDPDLLRITFTATGTFHRGDGLTWAERELIAASASRTNQCFY
ncbi:carboxymuconolactone decarboxylase family protein [Polyangium sp. y55x31]|uniref:carboxymuconolactone decarboxylase family protein n=1 Tax=Polyangium sp. y55x31 TaxID=3042688 RepID=UPI0024829CFB|nr:carboxymuconolactone decarboxylase family protein [Polyangium sp. y55x31]MDI1483791.1 carboxymuconolactone decarboxylase family protein [Polyangium sp. y55x31]